MGMFTAWCIFRIGRKNNLSIRDYLLKRVKYPSIARVVWILILTGIVFTGSAQQINFRNYNVEDGLIQSYVLCISQDQKGYLWFGTADGLSKFDGHGFTNYNKKDGLAHNYTISSMIDNEGRLWFGHKYGQITIYNPEEDLFEEAAFFKEKTARDIDELFQSADQTVWIGTRGDGIWRFDGDEVKHDLDGHMIWTINQDRSGRVWLGTSHGLYVFDDDSFIQVANLRGNNIFDILEDKMGNIWLATHRNGIYIIPQQVARTQNYHRIKNAMKNFNTDDGLANNQVFSMLEDSKGNIWLGTIGGGVSKYIPTQNGKNLDGIFKSYNTTNGLAYDLVYYIFEDKEKNIWFGTQNGGVSQLPLNIDRFELYTKNEGLIHYNIWAIMQDSNGDFWFKTDKGLSRAIKSPITGKFIKYYHYLTDNELYYHEASALIEARDRTVWVGTAIGACYMSLDDSVFHCLDTDDGLLANDVKSICEDDKGNLLFATYKGISVYNLKTKRISGLTIENGLNSNSVNVLFKDNSGNIWIGTENGGISRYDGKQIVSRHKEDSLFYEVQSITQDNKGYIWFTTQGGGIYQYEPNTLKMVNNYRSPDGLSSDNPYSLICDNNNILFIGTSSGIDKLDPRTGIFKHYGLQEGYLGIENNKNAIHKDNEGNLWFGTVRGVIKYIPSKDIMNMNPPFTYIKNIRVDYNVAPFPENNEFSPNVKFITFDFVALSFTNPEKIRYQWKLLGYKKEWSPPTEQNFVTYSNLPTGQSYIFQVRACNNDGVWNKEPAAYSFYITTPFYKTEWFVLLCILFGIGLIYIYIRLRTISLVKERKLLAKVVSERTQQVKKEKEKVEDVNRELKQEKEKVEEVNRELKNEKEKVEEVNHELEKLSIVASETDNGVMIADAQGIIEWCNEGMTKMTGYTLDDLKQLHGKTLIETSVNAEMANIIQESITKRSSVVYESNNITKDNKEIWVSSTLTPIFDDTGELSKMVVIETDITERKLVMEELRKAKERAENSEKIKEQFLANMSHEIRTPMNGIIGMLTLLEKTELDKKQNKYLDTINTSAENLLVIINDILDFSKIEAGKITFEAVEFKLSNLIENVVRIVEIKANEKNLQVKTNIDEKLPPVIIGDSVRLNQILINLLDNAVKFTEKGHVTIKASLLKENKSEVVINFEIIDTGIGIPEDKLSLIFQSFTQASSDTTRKYGGTGLGLTIVKQLVELQEGAISATSKPGQGTTFKVTLKFKKSTKTELDFDDAISQEEIVGSFGKLRVLIVDDSDLNQQVAYNLLKEWNDELEIDLADNGKIAIHKLKTNTYDLILMDIQMPKMDGYETTRFIRNKLKPPFSEIPILAMTAHAIEGEADKCFEAGMNDYISKPIVANNLYTKVFQLIKQFDVKPVKPSKPKPVVTQVDMGDSVVDLDRLRDLTDGNIEMMQTYISIFLKNIPNDVETMLELLNSKDWDQLKVIAHKIKGNASYMGIKKLGDIIPIIETNCVEGTDLDEIPPLVKQVAQICNKAIKELESLKETL